VAAKLRERLSVSKQIAQKSDMQRFDLKKLNDADIKEQYWAKLQTGLQLWKTLMVMWI
jgi:DNA repair ATPase RecN